MNRIQYRIACCSLVVLLIGGRASGQLIPNLGGQRAGISAFQFLKIGVGARGVALGETFVAIANDASALYWNPAGLVQFNDNQLLIAHAEYVVDIKHEFLGTAYHLSSNDVVGFSVASLHMNDMPVTKETQPFGTGEYFSFGDVAVGLTYSKRMTDQFSFGVTFRYVEETLDVLKMRGVVADLGTFYMTGLGSSRFAVVVTNFGADVTPSGEVETYNEQKLSSFQSFSPPTQFKIGFAMEPMEMEHQRITTSIELNHPNDNAENVHLGIEYQWEKWLWLRGGIKRTIGERLLGRDNSSSSDVTAGFGVAIPTAFTDIKLDYAYANFNALGSVHRISLGFSY
ncbi:MAG: PorV/PorQ family protein [Ignavibacteriae bacterium]|nr:PorV/PorQ family protein [Ignavibacteria bacterium]MBI3363737.1 PorV/PorQ family protein [Ignavibacteriota bacterium]